MSCIERNLRERLGLNSPYSAVPFRNTFRLERSQRLAGNPGILDDLTVSKFCEGLKAEPSEMV